MKSAISLVFFALIICNYNISMAGPARIPSRPLRRPSDPAPVDHPIDPNAAAVYIVYTEKPQDNEEPESYHIRTLSVIGSEEAARDALIYSYKNAASGFSAKLTPHQVAQISAQPGVLQVVPSRTYQLHSGPGGV
ncbi:unnamed protein product [Rhodiola kirilowii]